MKAIILAILSFLNFNLHADEILDKKIVFTDVKEEWTNEFSYTGASCPLYRKRLANYYQRISEVDNAQRAEKGKMTIAEINKMVELMERTGVPLMTQDLATYKGSVLIGDLLSELISDANNSRLKNISIRSSQLNWKSDTFSFPTDVFEVSVSRDSKSLTFKFHMPYSEACLQSGELVFDITLSSGKTIEIIFNLDKYNWDLSSEAYRLTQIISSPDIDLYKIDNYVGQILNLKDTLEVKKNMLMIILNNPRFNMYFYAGFAKKLLELSSSKTVPNKEYFYNEVDKRIASECRKISSGEIQLYGLNKINQETDCWDFMNHPFSGIRVP